MRPALAALIWIILIGGLSAYMHNREAAQPLVAYRFHQAEGGYSLEVVATFAMEPDPFALLVEDREPSALLIRLNGKEVLRKTDRLEPGLPLRVEHVAGVVQGENEFYIEANPPIAWTSRYNALRVRVLLDGRVQAEHSSWSEPGARIADTFRLAVTATRQKERAHGH